MADSKLAVLRSQCLDMRIPDQHALKDEVDVRENARNSKRAKAERQLTAANARVKLKQLYSALRTTRPTGEVGIASAFG